MKNPYLKLIMIASGGIFLLGCSTLPSQPGKTGTGNHPTAQTATLTRRDEHCLRFTGTHINYHGQCLPEAGNSYSAQQLRQTGATDVGQALSQLDPAVSGL